MLNPYVLVFVILCHAFLFYEYRKEKNISKTKEQQEQIIKITLKKKDKSSSSKTGHFSNSSQMKMLSFNKLGIGTNVQSKKYLIQELKGNEGGTTTATLYTRINEGVIYPFALSSSGISGQVSALIYIDEDGRYHEDKSRFNYSSGFLGVHVRLILRHTLKTKLRIKKIKAGHYPALFIFELSTGLSNKKKRLLENGKMTFYRRSYGGDTGIDKINYGLTKTLIGVSNIISLLEYLPSNQKKKKQMRLNYLERLKQDPSWGK